jgi:hypothetical protein
MQDLINAVTQIGILPVIILFLLWDYSKKLATLQVELIAANTMHQEVKKHSELILAKLEKIEDKL